MAKGSQTTYGGWEPRVCTGCGEKIVKTTEQGGLMFLLDHRTMTGYSWHMRCRRKK